MKKFEPLFAHLLRLFIDTDRLKKKNGKKRSSIEEKDQDQNDQNNLAESQPSS